jgi:hypothetical protein
MTISLLKFSKKLGMLYDLVDWLFSMAAPV